MTAKWIGMLSIAAMSFTGWSQSQLQDRFAITADQVARAVSTGGIGVAGAQVSLLANVVATEPNPLLDVVAVSHSAIGGPKDTPELILGSNLPVIRLTNVYLFMPS